MTDITEIYRPPRITLPTPDIDFATENARCGCVVTDLTAFRQQAGVSSRAINPQTNYEAIASSEPVFLTEETVREIRQAVSSLHSVFENPVYKQEVLKGLPAIAQTQAETRSVLTGYDFHLTSGGPKLIEVNTNAGGALLVTSIMRAQQACCQYIEDWINGFGNDGAAEQRILQSFRSEWQRAGRAGQPAYLAIVDETPTQQFLYPELCLFRELFQSSGIKAEIVAPEELQFRQGRLMHGDQPVDMVYNRLTDFMLTASTSQPIAEVLADDAVVVSPSPRHHALIANKHNLARLSDPAAQDRWGLSLSAHTHLAQILPPTVLVTRDNADELWQSRKHWFFKPVAGYGSRGAYRGDKLTRRVWQQILAGNYIAQGFVPPGESTIMRDGVPVTMKLDIRAYVYDGEVQLLAARRYQGQTTNMRTPGGGFACVYATGAGPHVGN